MCDTDKSCNAVEAPQLGAPRLVQGQTEKVS